MPIFKCPVPRLAAQIQGDQADEFELASAARPMDGSLAEFKFAFCIDEHQ